METISNNGISHLLEHMMFKGTVNRSAQEIAEVFDKMGGELNAFTSKEFTCFYAKVLDTHKHLAVEVLADIVINATIDDEELAREKQVVKEEIHMTEDTPDDIVHDLLEESAFPHHSIGLPILGTKENVQGFSRDELLQFKDTFYVASNIVISVAGNVEPDFIQQIEKDFSKLSSQPLHMNWETPVFTSNQIVKQKEIEQAHICKGYQGISMQDDNIYSMLLVNNLLGGSMSSRLFQDIRERHGLAYAIFSYHSTFLDTGLLTIYAGTSNEQRHTVDQKIDDMIEELWTQSITDKELTNGKEQLKGMLMLSLESTSSKMSRNARNEWAISEHPTIDQVQEEIDQVDVSQINHVVTRLFERGTAHATITPSSLG